jgi:hypothetical protein
MEHKRLPRLAPRSQVARTLGRCTQHLPELQPVAIVVQGIREFEVFDLSQLPVQPPKQITT